MSKSKRVFFFIAILFFIILLYASYDISNRTTFPHSNSQLKEGMKVKQLITDTLKEDSIQ